MALGRGGTSHQQYTQDGQAQIAMVVNLRAAYASLGTQQLGDLEQIEHAQKEVAEAQKRAVQQRHAEADATEHQAKLLRIQGADQRDINRLQQQALEQRKQAALAAGNETEVLKQLRQQELIAVRETADARKKAEAEAKSESERVNRGIDAVKSHWMEATAAVYAMVQGIRAADAAMQAAFSQRAIMGNLPFQIDAVRTATLGLVDDMELGRIAVEANRFGVAKSEKDMAVLAEAATKLGLSVGKDATSSIADLNLALARGSPLILDNLGIQLKLGEAHRLFAERLGVSESALTEEQKQTAFMVIGKEKALEAAKKVNLSLVEQEHAWIGARQQWQKMVRETIPEFTKKSTGLWQAVNEGGKLAERILPLVSVAIDGIGTAIKPVIGYVAFFAEQLAMIGDAVDATGDVLTAIGQGAERVGEFGTEVRSWADAAQLAKEAGSDLRSEWEALRNSIGDTEQGEIATKLQGKLNELLARGRDVSSETLAQEGTKLAALEEAVTQSGYMVELAEAQKRPASELEKLYQLQHRAKIALLEATGKQAEVEKELWAEATRKAAARSKGGGPTDADRMKAEGEIQLDQWRATLRFMEAETRLDDARLPTARNVALARADAARFAGYAHNIAIEELRLEQQVLEVTRAKNSVERARIDARLYAIDVEVDILDTEKQAAAVEQERNSEREAASLRIADLDRQIERNEALGVNVDLLWRQRDAEALIAAAREGDEPLKQAMHEQEMRRIEDVQRAEKEREDNREAWLKRLKERAKEQEKAEAEQAKKFQDGIALTSKFMQAGHTLAGTLIDATIKDEDKRAKAHLRADGIAAMGVGALETVQAVAAFASLNVPQGIAHTAAAALAFVQGGLMLSGNIPSGGGAAAASSGSSGNSSGGGQQRNTSAAPTVPDSEPSAADRGPRRIGGPASQMQQGGFTLVIQGDVNGNLDEETAEKWTMAMRRAGYSSEAAA